MTNPRNDISQEYVKALLQYNPEDGVFTWRMAARCIKAGDKAGSLCSDGYVRVKIDGKLYASHRVAWLYMTGEWPTGDVDHRDTDRTNNRWDNLRAATRSQNIANKGPQNNNRLGLKGVSKHHHRGYTARISIGGKQRVIGLFATAEEAHAAYMAAAKETFGEFARAS